MHEFPCDKWAGVSVVDGNQVGLKEEERADYQQPVQYNSFSSYRGAKTGGYMGTRGRGSFGPQGGRGGYGQTNGSSNWSNRINGGDALISRMPLTTNDYGIQPSLSSFDYYNYNYVRTTNALNI